MNEKIFNEGNQIHNFMSSSGSGTVTNYGSGSDFLTSYGSGYGSGSTSQKVTVPVPVPQHCFRAPVKKNLSLDPLLKLARFIDGIINFQNIFLKLRKIGCLRRIRRCQKGVQKRRKFS